MASLVIKLPHLLLAISIAVVLSCRGSWADSRLASPSTDAESLAHEAAVVDHSRFNNMDGAGGPDTGSRDHYQASSFSSSGSNSGLEDPDSGSRAPASLVLDSNKNPDAPVSPASNTYAPSAYSSSPYAPLVTPHYEATEVSGRTSVPPPGVRESSTPAPASVNAPSGSQASSYPPLDDVSAQVSSRGVQEVAVIANDLGFFPKTLFVTRDVPVRLFVTGASKNTLCIMMDSFGVRKEIRARQIEEISFTPTTPGKYRFYCPVNGMEGSLVVKELSSVIPPARLPASSDSQ